MLKLILSVFSGLGVFLVVTLGGPALAMDSAQAPSSKSSYRSIIQGVLQSESGQRFEFSAMEGQPLSLTKEGEATPYRGVFKVVDGQHVIFELFDAAQPLGKARKLEALELKVGDKGRASAVVPFTLEIKGTEQQLVSQGGACTQGKEDPRTQGKEDPRRITPQWSEGGCCASCGGWEVCCEAAAGRCCSVRSSCGTYCRGCSTL